VPTKAEIAKTQAFLKGLGITVPEVENAAKAPRNLEKEYPPPTQQTSREMASAHAEHVLLSLEYPALAGVPKLCKECNAPFTTRYPSVGYCGDMCRASALRKRGIIWWAKGTTEQEKWGGRIPPGMIPPEALRAMKTIVNRVELETQSQVQTTLPDFVEPKPFVSQQPENTEYPVEFAAVIQDKIAEVQPQLIPQEEEEDFSELLDVLDGL
jgi:hypothetical protein